MHAQLKRILILSALLLNGCDAPQTPTSVECDTPTEGRDTSQKNSYDACVLGHKNTQSDDRKW